VESVIRPLLIFDMQGVLVDAAGGWIANPGALESLAGSFRFAVLTASPRDEVDRALDRFAPDLGFDPIAGAPESLQGIAAQNSGAKLYYVGDSVDAAAAARDAGVAFIGIAGPANPQYLDLVFAFQELGAYAIVDDINFLHEVFA
jgi:phosphoglycolate phosphatase-like HAD superfamily hydrolase